MSTPLVARLAPGVVQTLAAVVDALTITQHAWWLIGGGALAVHGLTTIKVADIDILMSASDARLILAALKIAPDESGGTGRLRSDVFGRWTGVPLPVDFMGGLSVRTGNRWHRLRLRTRKAIQIEARRVYVPSREEMIRICRLFGRPKDIERAAALAMLN